MRYKKNNFLMNNLFLINETFTNGYISNVLDILSLLAFLSGIFVIISKNPVISVLFLIGLFASISSYLIILGLSFIGLSYLIVYVGAVTESSIEMAHLFLILGLFFPFMVIYIYLRLFIEGYAFYSLPLRLNLNHLK